MLNQLLRYYPVLEMLARNSPQTILEVGSGSTGLGKYVDFQFIGVDENFTDYSGTPQPIAPNMTPVVARASQLPFADESFDMVICVDTLEHILPAEREQTVMELLRVTSHTLFLSCPCDQHSQDHDRALRDYLTRKRIPVPGWLDEHLNLEVPRKEELLDLVSRQNFTCTIVKNEGLPVHSMIMKSEFSPVSRLVLNLSMIADAMLCLTRRDTAIVYRHPVLSRIILALLRRSERGTPYRIGVIVDKDSTQDSCRS